jgi:hypothetical protein
MSSTCISVVLRRHPDELAAETTETLNESYPLKVDCKTAVRAAVLVSARQGCKATHRDGE